MGKGAGFGKTILIGDQFVLDGVPAVVSSISYETECVVERIQGYGWVLEDDRNEIPGYKESKRHHQIESINRVLEVMKIDTRKTPLRISYGGTLLAGSGVGASAASCVSLARAINEEFSLGLPADAINQIAWEGEFAYHGVPSGVDNTASTYGGLLLYHLKGDEKIVEKIKVRKPIEIVLGNSGVSADTRMLEVLVENEKTKNKEVFDARMQAITAQSMELKACLEKNDLARVGQLMTENHKILVEMGLSHPRLDYLCDLARSLGVPGAKLTGGGMGGYMVALTPGEALQDKVAKAMQAEGYFVIKASVGGA
ncbi:MAG: mevalonate kinase [Syntrophobacteraceae bacterium]|nr:mevalonate kinase [Desulfobacteraceae bacterium]